MTLLEKIREQEAKSRKKTVEQMIKDIDNAIERNNVTKEKLFKR